jgi:hypothetical protein
MSTIRANEIASWMLAQIELHGCIYQDDVVDFLTRSKADDLLRENSDGNVVLSKEVLNEFKALTELNVVWVKPDRYWRFRVAEDEPGREARG